MKIAVMFHRLGPYHNARLKAASAHATIVALELSAVDPTYAWQAIETDAAFERITVFEDEDVFEVAPEIVERRLATLLDEVKPDVLALPGWSMTGAFAAMVWAVERKIPTVLMSASTEEDEPRRWHKEAIKKQYVNLFQAGLGGGTRQAAYLHKLGLPEEAIFRKYNVIDNAYFQQRADAASQLADVLRPQYKLPKAYLLASNRFIPKKNLARLLEAYAVYQSKMGASAWDLVMLGDGPLDGELRQQTQTLELSDVVHFKGFQQYDVLPIYYGLAQAFVQASTTEQWGLVVNEAMASGLPVVVSERCGCAPDLVQDGRNGFSFDPHNTEALTQALYAITEADLAEMRAASRALIDTWTPDHFGQSLAAAATYAQNQPLRRKPLLAKPFLHMLMRKG